MYANWEMEQQVIDDNFSNRIVFQQRRYEKFTQIQCMIRRTEILILAFPLQQYLRADRHNLYLPLE